MLEKIKCIELPRLRRNAVSSIFSLGACLFLQLGFVSHAHAQRDASDADYAEWQKLIGASDAGFVDVLKALSDPQPGRLVNTVHLLWQMRWQPQSRTLLGSLWRDNGREQYPHISWELFAKPPVRLALASVLLRMRETDSGEYLDYLLEHREDQHEFNRAQVIVGLGLNGDPGDVPYLEERAEKDTDYVVQSAITALGLMDDAAARMALARLWKANRGEPKGNLAAQVLKNIYWVEPGLRGVDDIDKERGSEAVALDVVAE
ncbi:MAG: HEAT repeat domain-containing protein [Candidatus Eutrophobiaceae bacterium]